jgi:hypothetical protein
MSALPTPPNPDELPVGFRDIAFAILIGSLSWLVRHNCASEEHSIRYILRRGATAAVTSLQVGFAVKGYLSSGTLAFPPAGGAGYASPELLDSFLARIKAMKVKSPAKGD